MSHNDPLLRRAAAVSVAAYILTSLTLSGIPVWSRLSAGAFVLLTIVSIFYALHGRLVFSTWVWGPIAFVACCAYWSILVWETAVAPLMTVVVAWGGALLVAVHVQNGVRIRLVLNTIVAASVVNIVAALLGFDTYAIYSADFTLISEQGVARRASALVGNSNAFAIQTILPLFALVLWREHVTRSAFIVALSAASYALISSGSRTGVYLTGVFLPFAAYGIPHPKLRKTVVICSLVIVLGSAFLFLAGGIALLPESVQQVEAINRIELALSGGDTSYLSRMDFIARGIDAFLKSPVIGNGLDTFRFVTGAGTYAHNNLIELAVNGGIVMLAFYYLLYAVAAIRAYRAYRAYDRRRYLTWLMLLVMLGLEMGAVTYTDKCFVLLLITLLMMPSLCQASRHVKTRRSRNMNLSDGLINEPR